MKINLPLNVLYILKRLEENSYEAFIVGGCVRDSIMNMPPKDWDIATSAKPHEIKSLFGKTADTGLKHGTVSVYIDGECFEVTTYRIDGIYKDNRRPESVTFTSSLYDDLSRRDFTINSIAYHPSTGFIDPFNGINDIKKHIIRTVGNPNARFHEDALRMLRCIRFSAQLGFDIDTAVLDSIKNNNSLIKNISYERVRDELTKILLSSYPHKFSLLRETGLLHHILPEFEICFDIGQKNPYHLYNVAEHSLKAVEAIEKTPVLRWTMLLHDTGKALTKTTDEKGIDHFYGHPARSAEIASTVLRRLKFEKKSIAKILRLIENHDRPIEPNFVAVKKALRDIGIDMFDDLLKVKRADMKAQNPDLYAERSANLDMVMEIYQKIKELNHCITLKDLAITGQDLLDIGFRQGPELGIILNRLLDKVIENPDLNQKEILIKAVDEIKQILYKNSNDSKKD